ncbi:MAG: hypothetical protein ACP6IU_05970 [Candidatus Asgardarchaeia archaeon]
MNDAEIIVENLITLLAINAAKTFKLFHQEFLVDLDKNSLKNDAFEIKFLLKAKKLLFHDSRHQSKFIFNLKNTSEKALWATLFALLSIS